MGVTGIRKRREVSVKMPEGKTYAGRTICFMAVFPAVFIALYPLIYLILPETMAIRADLPRDISLILLLDGILVPLTGAGLFIQARRRAARGAGWGREDTRDVY